MLTFSLSIDRSDETKHVLMKMIYSPLVHVAAAVLYAVPIAVPVISFSPLQAVEAKLSLDTLLQMTGAQVRDTMRRLGSSSEECARLSAALSCLKSATESGMCPHCGSQMLRV